MITLNLIPESQKSLLKKGRNFSAFREVVMLVFLFASIIAMMLWLSRYFLEEKLSDIAQQNSAGILSNEFTSGRIAKINSQINSTKLIANNYLPIRPTLESFLNLVPENVAIKSLTFVRGQAALSLSGIAKTRNDLLAFKQRLEAAPGVSNINLPMSDLIEKDNNSFDITLSIDFSKFPSYEN